MTTLDTPLKKGIAERMVLSAKGSHPTGRQRGRLTGHRRCFDVEAKRRERWALTPPGSPASLSGAQAASGPLAGPIRQSNCLLVPRSLCLGVSL